jgi:kynureninase
MAAGHDRFDTSEKCATGLDRRDPLAAFRERFFIPPGAVYMDGNSLGLLSKEAEARLTRTIEEWRSLGIRGWLEAKPPWFHLAEELGAMAAPLVGAAPEEVVATGTTTLNIHSLVSTLYRPSGKRVKIIASSLDFPTDLYAVRSQIALRGIDPREALLLVPRDGGSLVDEDEAVELMRDDVALVCLPSVFYRSGQLLDMRRLAAKARERGIMIGFDCSHSVGAVKHELDAWGVDFAVWCGYKYLNGGPGSPAFLYLNRRHFDREPGLAGWFGYVKDKQFDLCVEFEHARGAGGWQISSPGIIASSVLLGSIAVTLEAGIDAIREKSLALTSYLMFLVDAMLSAGPYRYSIATPREAERRGGHVAVAHDEALRICEALKARGVVPDFRPPSIIRIAPVALYNTFHEVWEVAHALKGIVDGREHERFPKTRRAIS